MTLKQNLTFAAGTMRARWVCLSLAVVGALVVSTARAQVIFDSLGFEAPDYSTTFPPAGPQMGTGILEGQPNPLNIVTPDVWRKSMDPGTSLAIVQSAVKLTGNQAVKLTRGVNSNIRWGTPPFAGSPPTQRYVFVDWDMRVEGPVGNPATQFGPFFGIQTYDDHLNVNNPLLISGFGVDASTGKVNYQTGGTGALQDTNENVSVTFGDWNHFQMKLDYLLGEYKFSVNNVPLSPVMFFPNTFVTPGVTKITDVDLTGIVAGPSVAEANFTGTAYYDNVIVRQAPEPGTLVLAAMSLVGLLVGLRKGHGRRQ